MHLLTINTGSSSLKAALYRIAATERRELAIHAARIGHTDGTLRIADDDGAILLDERRDLSDHAAALAALFAWLRDRRPDLVLDAVGHRVVHGGDRYREPVMVGGELIAALRALVPLDPEHPPQALVAIAAVGRDNPGLPQIACFDKVFHRRTPEVARTYALPRAYREARVRRFGFHGLSHESSMGALRAEGDDVAEGRVIIDLSRPFSPSTHFLAALVQECRETSRGTTVHFRVCHPQVCAIPDPDRATFANQMGALQAVADKAAGPAPADRPHQQEEALSIGDSPRGSHPTVVGHPGAR